jgi:hypothetical protein
MRLNWLVKLLMTRISVATDCIIKLTNVAYNVFLTVHQLSVVSVTNLMHKFLFIHIILQPSTYFEQYCAHPQKVTLYTCSMWYPHSLWAVVVFMRYTGSRSACIPHEHHDRSKRLTIPHAACIQCALLRMSVVLLETCRWL